jgi:hypothetical protein
MDELTEPQLEPLAPIIDEDASLALFRSRRARRQLRRRASQAVLAVGAVAVVGLGALFVFHDDSHVRVVAVADGPTTTALAEPADAAQARADIVAAFEHAHDGSLTIEERDTAVDDATGLAAIAHEISDEFGPAAGLIRAENIKVDFTSATTARVPFSIVSQSGTFARVGGAVLTADGWKMTRATRCHEFEPAGKYCP